MAVISDFKATPINSADLHTGPSGERRYGYGLLWQPLSSYLLRRYGRRIKPEVHIGWSGQRVSLCGLPHNEPADPFAYADISCPRCIWLLRRPGGVMERLKAGSAQREWGIFRAPQEI